MESPTPKKNSLINDKKSKANKLDGFLESIIKNNKDMINTFKSTQSLLSNMDNHMTALVQKLQRYYMLTSDSLYVSSKFRVESLCN